MNLSYVAARLIVGEQLFLFFSQVGHAPEHILLSTINLNADWSTWQNSEPASVLRFENDYEGANEPVCPSIRGLAHHPMNELRDPAVFVDNAGLAIFVDSECPISSRYAPTIQDLYSDYAARVAISLIYPNPQLDEAQIRAHIADYKLAAPALRDPDHKLVKLARANVTPEAAAFDSNGQLVYHGRINDRFVDFNQQRPAPTRRDVAAVLDALLAGQSVPPRQTAAPGSAMDALHQRGVGCFVTGLK